MSGKYELKDTSDGQYMFNLKAGNGETILTSERYKQKQAAEKGIESVRTNSPIDDRYMRLQSSSGQPYFNLRAANNQIIGTSEMYSSAQARNNGIESVKTHGPDAVVSDQT